MAGFFSRQAARAESILSADSNAQVPILLLGLMCILSFQQSTFFMGLPLVKTLPVIAMSARIRECARPTDLVSLAGVRVVLMHISFLSLRIFSGIFCYHDSGLPFNLLSFALVGIVFNMVFFRARRADYNDAALLTLYALSAAATMGLIDRIFGLGFVTFSSNLDMAKLTVRTGYEYAEILTFVPAIWVLYRHNVDFLPIDQGSEVSRQNSLFLLAITVGFYAGEDVIGPMNRNITVTSLDGAVHVVRFLLLTDLLLIVRPLKEKDHVSHIDAMKWIPDRLNV